MLFRSPAHPVTPLGQVYGSPDNETLNGASPTNATIVEGPEEGVFDMDLEVEEAMSGELADQESEEI